MMRSPALPSRRFRLGLVLAALLPLAACSGNGGAPDTDTPAPAATAAAPAQAEARPGVGQLVPGRDYVEIPNGQPLDPANGQVEVVEVFGYTCPHCAHFEPLVEAWRAKLPQDVRFTRLAAPFGGHWTPYARAFYAAQAMGLVDRTHGAMFKAIHEEQSLPVQPPPSDAQLAEFYARFGADPKEFASTLSSFPVQAGMQRASQFIERTGVDGTPTLVVDGRYRVLGQSFEDQLRIADALIAAERAARPGATASAPAAARSTHQSPASAPATD